jgi:ABC-2 type transport system ATP-binding protein
MLDVRDVTVRAGSRILLEGVSFAAEPGEVVGVIGPNGAGKTTLLEVLVGLRQPDSASITFCGGALRTFNEKAQVFAFFPDSAELAPELEVPEHVSHAFDFKPRAPEIIEELRAALAISELLDAPAGVLSRGERQRVALFCALAVERPVVVLDEPFNAFDPVQLRRVLGVVRRLAEAGATIVTSVHQLRDAERIADRVLLLAEGRRIAWGDLPSLRAEISRPDADLEEVFIALLERRSRAA